MMSGRTIFALSSGSGRAGVGVIRVSGHAAFEAFALFSIQPTPPRRAVLRRLRDANGEVIDEALVLCFAGPASATGEDLVEFHVHGSPAIIEAVLGRLADAEDFGFAEPGAFTYRAYRNGKLDLLQVEGLSDVLVSETVGQRRLAMRQFLGESSSIFDNWRGEVLRSLALVEAAIDFSEEDDVLGQAFTEASGSIQVLIDSFERALVVSAGASAVRRGLRVVLAGPPNVGKSSLLNWLVGRDAAIVSPVAGTTRDVVEAAVVLEGVPILVSDTAGLRVVAGDALEREGIARTARTVEDADILVWVEAVGISGDVNLPRTADMRVLNKIDIAVNGDGRAMGFGLLGVWPVSAKSGLGLPELRNGLTELIRARNQIGEGAVVVRERHRQSLLAALHHLKSAQTSSKLGLEFMAEDMRKAAQALAEITGRIDVEDLLGHIFSEFCIGK